MSNDQNPKQAFGDRKVKLQLVPPAASIAIATGLEEGAEKYGPWNWRDDPVELMTYFGALKRHMDAWLEGEDSDPDGDGKTHLDGAIASLAILIDAQSLGEGRFIDNRPSKSSPGALDSLTRGARTEAALMATVRVDSRTAVGKAIDLVTSGTTAFDPDLPTTFTAEEPLPAQPDWSTAPDAAIPEEKS